MSDEIALKKSVIACTFCGKSRSEVDQMIEGPEVFEKKIYMCNECIDMIYGILHPTGDISVKVKDKKKRIIYTPEKIKEYLDQFIVGQDNAKKVMAVAFYNHFKRIYNKTKVDIEKSNILMIGSSGTGKTYTIKTIAKLFDIPYIIADATSFTEYGYSGNDVEELITRLIQSAKGDLNKAKHGIIFIDEIDKKIVKSNGSSFRDVSGEGVQQSLLKLIDGTVISVNVSDEQHEFDTKDILFVCSGAFVGLDKTMTVTSNGIGFNAVHKPKVSAVSEVTKSCSATDLIKFGLIPEFVGRLPVTVVFDDLNEDSLYKILKEPKSSLTEQYSALFSQDKVKLEFDDSYLRSVAKLCVTQKTGARGLRNVIEKDLLSTQFLLPSLRKSGVKKVIIKGTNMVEYVKSEVTSKKSNNIA